MSIVSGIGGTISPLPPPVIGLGHGSLRNHVDAAASQTAQARNATDATPRGSEPSDTAARRDGERGHDRKSDTPGQQSPVGGTPSQALRATARSVIEAQLSFLIAPPFDGEPSPEAMAQAASEKMRFQLLLDAINARTAAQSPPAADRTDVTAAQPAA